MLRDRYGEALSTGSVAARDAYVTGCDLLLSSNLGAATAFKAAVAADEGFVAGHVALARSRQMAGRMAEARGCLAAARAVLDGVSARERSQVGIFELMLGGDGAGALAAIRAHVGEWPRDALALSPACGVFGLIGFSGLAGRERAQLELLAPLEGVYGGDWWFLASLAFAEIEMGEVARGRGHVEASLRGNPRNANAAHVLSHGYYEGGDGADGVRFLTEWMEGYAAEAPLHSHLSWHLALWAMQRGDLGGAWEIYDAWLRPGVCRGPGINQVTDAASFLFRAGLAGAKVEGELWGEVSAVTAEVFPAPGVAFIDLHAGLAHAMAGDGEKLARLVEGVRGPAGGVVAAASGGFAAFARGDWEGVVRELGAVLGEHERFGGSRAQRDLLEYSVACGLMRVGRGEAARGMLEERGRWLGGGVPVV